MALGAPGLGGSGLALHGRGGGLIAAPAQVLAQLDARSNSLLGLTPGIAGMVQPFPATAAAYLAAMPGTAAIAANVQAAYLCANIGAQIDSLALGPNLAQTLALDSRVAVALAGGSSFAAKLAIELLGGAQYYADAGTAFGNANGSIVTVHGAFRIRPGAAATETWIASKWDGTHGWTLSCSSTYLRATAAGSGTTQRASIAVDPRDGAWHWFILTLDDTGKVVSLFSDLGSATSAAYTGSVTNAGHCSLGYTASSFAGQIAVCYVLNAALTAADGAAFWRHALAAGLAGVTNTYARTNPIRVAVPGNRIGGFGAGQVPFAYHPSLPVDAANALLTGEVLNVGMAFLGINSANLPGWTGTNATLTAADGPSGMRDAVQVASTSNGGYASSGTATGLSTHIGDSFAAGVLARRGAADTNATVSLYLSGSGGGAEEIICKTLTGTVPVAESTYPDADGKCPTWYGSAQCAHAGQTSAVMRCYPQIGAATGTVVFSEAWAMTGTAVPPLAYRATAAGAAVSTSIPSEQCTNVGNARYTPAKGSLTLSLAGFVNPAGCAPVAVAGSPFATGANPFGVAIDALGQAWIANYGGGTVTVYNVATKAVVGTYATGVNPYGVAIDALGQAWITNYGGGTVTVYNVATKALVGTYATGANPVGVAIDALGQAWIVNYGSSTVTVYNVATKVLVGTYATGANPRDVAIDALGQAWITNYSANTVTVYNVATKALVGTYATGANPFGVAIDALGQAWIANYGASTVTVYNVATKAVVGTYATGTGPYGVAIDALGQAWITNYGGGTVTVYNVATKVLVGTYATGVNPFSVAIDALGQAWIANYGSNTVTVYSTRPVLLSLGAEGAPGALIIDYAGNLQLAPLFMSAANLRVRNWDNTPALIGGAAIMCGTLDNLGHTLKVQWNAATGSLVVKDGAAVIGSYAGAAWTPGAADCTPVAVGADTAGANAARAIFARLQLLSK
jgi:hypothetical protein